MVIGNRVMENKGEKTKGLGVLFLALWHAGS